jgi:hypothetical protein
MSTTTTKPQTTTGYLAETYTSPLVERDDDGNARIETVFSCQLLLDGEEVGWARPVKNIIALPDAAVELACQHRNAVERMPEGQSIGLVSGLGRKPEDAVPTGGLIPVQRIMPHSPRTVVEQNREVERVSGKIRARNEATKIEGYKQIAAEKNDPSLWHGGPGGPAFAA